MEISPDGSVWRVVTKVNAGWGEGRVWKKVPKRCRKRVVTMSNGYFAVFVCSEGKSIGAMAHRLVYRHFYGPIPEGLTVNHKDGNKTNNHPDNLEVMNDFEQMRHARDVLKVGTNGERNPGAKLTAEIVREIRRRISAGESRKALAKEYGVGTSAIGKIHRNERWREVDA